MGDLHWVTSYVHITTNADHVTVCVLGAEIKRPIARTGDLYR